jgi:hypothetical protein
VRRANSANEISDSDTTNTTKLGSRPPTPTRYFLDPPIGTALAQQSSRAASRIAAATDLSDGVIASDYFSLRNSWSLKPTEQFSIAALGLLFFGLLNGTWSQCSHGEQVRRPILHGTMPSLFRDR